MKERGAPEQAGQGRPAAVERTQLQPQIMGEMSQEHRVERTVVPAPRPDARRGGGHPLGQVTQGPCTSVSLEAKWAP